VALAIAAHFALVLVELNSDSSVTRKEVSELLSDKSLIDALTIDVVSAGKALSPWMSRSFNLRVRSHLE
jgi:hypothetical protein